MLVKRSRPRVGAVAPLVAICLVAVLGAVALALDLGILMDDRRSLQANADAAALAGAKDLWGNWQNGKLKSGAATAAKQKADAIATANKHGRFANGYKVIVNSPPTDGSAYGFSGEAFYVGKEGYIEVIIEAKEPRRFSAIWSKKDLTVRARAVARAIKQKPAHGVILLDPDDPQSFKSSGNGLIEVLNASIIVNAVPKTDNSGHISGNANVRAHDYVFSDDPPLKGWDPDPAKRGADAAKLLDPSGKVSDNVQAGADPTDDPLAGVPEPTFADAGLPRSSGSGGVSITKSQLDTHSEWLKGKRAMKDLGVDGLKLPNDAYYDPVKQEVHLRPGVYEGGIKISGNARVVLDSGIYYMDDGGFQISGNGALYGENVMVFNGGDKPGEFKVSGNGQLTLKAPTTGPWAGIALFQDRNYAQKEAPKLHFSGNFNGGDGYDLKATPFPGLPGFYGTIYAPTAELHDSGNSNLRVYPTNYDPVLSRLFGEEPLGGDVIVGTMQVSGNGDFVVTRPGGNDGNKFFGLVE